MRDLTLMWISHQWNDVPEGAGDDAVLAYQSAAGDRSSLDALSPRLPDRRG
jgi:hypothetical protein